MKGEPIDEPPPAGAEDVARAVLAAGWTVGTAESLVGRSSAWQVATATLAAAAVFRPALRAVRLFLDRRFDRDGHAARMRVDAFLEGLRSGTEQPDRIQAVLREALRDPRLRVLLFLPASGGFADLRGRPAEVDPGLSFPADRPTIDALDHLRGEPRVRVLPGQLRLEPGRRRDAEQRRPD